MKGDFLPKRRKSYKSSHHTYGGNERGGGGGNEKVMYSNIILKKDLDNRWITAVETRWIEDGNGIKNVAKKIALTRSLIAVHVFV